jgi:RHS repeat-associated protein
LESVDGPRTDVPDVTTFSYDAFGNLSSTTNALGHVLRVTQAMLGGHPLVVRDVNGVETRLTYDGKQRLTRSELRTAAGGLVSTYQYDPAGQLVRTTLPDGSFVSQGYDAAHRLVEVRGADAQPAQFALDPLGHRTQTSIPSGGYLQSATYDPLGRLETLTGGVGQVRRYEYDDNGNAVRETDGLGRTSTRAFDAMNREVSRTDALSGSTTSTYDALGRPLQVVAPNGATTTYAYDGFGSRIQEVSPDRGTIVYRYDLAGNLVRKVGAAGTRASYAYDALNRLTGVVYPDRTQENVTLRYDQAGRSFGMGRLTAVQDEAGTLARTYDERGNVLTETRRMGRGPMRTAYEYDAAGRVVSVTYPSGARVSYRRDAVGRISDVAHSASVVASNIIYAPFGPVRSLAYGNGITETRQFDAAYRIASIQGGALNLTYTYDTADNILSIVNRTRPADSQRFGYDALDRLVTATGGYGSLTYSYDGSGNRLSQAANGVSSSYAYASGSNRLLQVQGPARETYTYTADGSTASIRSPRNGATLLSYNQAGRLARVRPDGGGFEYTYDFAGQRLARTTPTDATFYQYDLAGHLLSEANRFGQPEIEYVYLDDRPIATFDPSTGRLAYLHTDHLGTPQIATNAARGTVWRARYEPFGKATVLTGAITQNLRLPGQEFEASTEWHHNGFRDYLPGLGRYAQSDLLGLGGGLNSYSYAGLNPGINTDRRGLRSINYPEAAVAAANCTGPALECAAAEANATDAQASASAFATLLGDSDQRGGGVLGVVNWLTGMGMVGRTLDDALEFCAMEWLQHGVKRWDAWSRRPRTQSEPHAVEPKQTYNPAVRGSSHTRPAPAMPWTESVTICSPGPCP